MKMWLITLALVIGLSVPAFAQDNSSQQQQSGQAQQQQQGSSQSSSQGGSSAQKSTTTTTTSQPTQVTRTTGVDPIWLVVGGVALLAILLIAILSMRGRRRCNDTVVRENTTVIRE